MMKSFCKSSGFATETGRSDTINRGDIADPRKKVELQLCAPSVTGDSVLVGVADISMPRSIDEAQKFKKITFKMPDFQARSLAQLKGRVDIENKPPTTAVAKGIVELLSPVSMPAILCNSH